MLSGRQRLRLCHFYVLRRHRVGTDDGYGTSMKLAIYNKGIPFNGDTPLGQPLGGTESSIVYMARELTLLGHDVTVYANCAEQGMYRGVPYVHCYHFFNDAQQAEWDAVISFRSFEPFLIGRVAPRMIYWTGDSYDQPSLQHFSHSTLQQNIDVIFCVSEWQRRVFIDRFLLPAHKMVATRNGFPADLLPEPTDHANRIWTSSAYSSTPFRGLDILLHLFSEMRLACPNLTLDVFSSMKVHGWTHEQDQLCFGPLYRAAEQSGVFWHGSVPQPTLLRHLSQTGLFLYPNTFDETSCIAAIEAQAAGCVVVTSARAALNETVENGRTGICIKGDPHGAEYQREFIMTAIRLLENPERMHLFSEAACKRARLTYSWRTIATEWTDILTQIPVSSLRHEYAGPLSLLQQGHMDLDKGNSPAVTQVLKELEKTPFLRNEVENLRGRLSTWT
jgi:glycosyltransferase involved in cell wall biosynthesis